MDGAGRWRKEVLVSSVLTAEQKREMRMDEIQVRADGVRAVLAVFGHACKQHPVEPERMDAALRAYPVEIVNEACIIVGESLHDAFGGLC